MDNNKYALKSTQYQNRKSLHLGDNKIAVIEHYQEDLCSSKELDNKIIDSLNEYSNLIDKVSKLEKDNERLLSALKSVIEYGNKNYAFHATDFIAELKNAKEAITLSEQK